MNILVVACCIRVGFSDLLLIICILAYVSYMYRDRKCYRDIENYTKLHITKRGTLCWGILSHNSIILIIWFKYNHTVRWEITLNRNLRCLKCVSLLFQAWCRAEGTEEPANSRAEVKLGVTNVTSRILLYSKTTTINAHPLPTPVWTPLMWLITT